MSEMEHYADNPSLPPVSLGTDIASLGDVQRLLAYFVRCHMISYQRHVPLTRKTLARAMRLFWLLGDGKHMTEAERNITRDWLLIISGGSDMAGVAQALCAEMLPTLMRYHVCTPLPPGTWAVTPLPFPANDIPLQGSNTPTS